MEAVWYTAYMKYRSEYESPLGTIVLGADEDALCGLWFQDQKYAESTLAEAVSAERPVFDLARAWLDGYFQGKKELPQIPLKLTGTPFQVRVWEALRTIPYGTVLTYGELAAALNSSPRAIGSAVGRNPVSLIIPCHRVIGKNGQLIGYAGGLARKEYLLKMEAGFRILEIDGKEEQETL